MHVMNVILKPVVRTQLDNFICMPDDCRKHQSCRLFVCLF